MTAWRAAAVYVVAAVILTFPVAFSLTSSLAALTGPGDPYLNLWILGWGLRTWTTNPGSVFNGQVFDANIFFPAEGTLAYSDHFLLQSFALAPLYAATGDVVLCYNLLALASIVLSGLAMHLLMRTLTGSEVAAYAAGLAWACWPYRTAHLLHLQLQALYFMPLAILFLHRVAARRRWRDVLALAVVTALQIVASVYYGVMTVLALVIGGVALAAATGQMRSWRLWSRFAIAGVVTVLVTMPAMLPYLRAPQLEGNGTTNTEVIRQSASLQSYTQVPPVNLVYGTTGLLDPRRPAMGRPDRTHVEHQMFPGFVLLGLALLGFARHVRSDARPLVISATALAASGLILSFGPDGWRWLYTTLRDNVFGFQAVREPARFAVIAMVGLAGLAALGIRWIDITARRHTLAVVLVVLLFLEFANAPLPLAAAPPQRTGVGQWLANEPLDGAVLHVPLGFDDESTPLMVQSLEHGRPIVNGYSGQRPPFYTSVVESLADFPSPTALALLREINVRFVVSQAPLAGAGNPRSPLVERARLSDGFIYELRWSGEALAALTDTTGPPPPPPGEAPFTAGEVAIYDVFWEGGPVDVPAGTATMTVIDGEPGTDRWEFETRAETANWVSAFFQARDRFVTVTDGQLLPVQHSREIREGRRQVDLRYKYDHTSNLIQTEQMALPLGSPSARDVLSAMYYVRTLDLAPGSIFTVPLNEAGASLVLQVSVGDVEEITRGGQQVRALRLEPRVMRRIERRQPVVITLWLATDDSRIPLRADVDAGFGRIRLELKEHRR